MPTQIPIDKSLDDVRQETFDNINSIQQAGFLPSKLNLNRGFIRGVIEVVSFAAHQFYLFLQTILKQAFVGLVDDDDFMDLHLGNVDLTRLQAKKTTGNVKFQRVVTVGNVTIPVDKIVKTQVDGLGVEHRFVTTVETILLDGESEVEVPVTAENAGAAGNVTTGEINELVTPIAGIDSVTNASDWLVTEGTDKESLAAALVRYRLQWLSQGGAIGSFYQSIALEITGVVSATVISHPVIPGTADSDVTESLVDSLAAFDSTFLGAKVKNLTTGIESFVVVVASSIKLDFHIDLFPAGDEPYEIRIQGTIDVVIVGVAGPPSPALIAEVQAAIDLKEPINDAVTVKGVTIVLIDIDIELEITQADSAGIIALVTSRLTALFDQSGALPFPDVTPVIVGQDVPQALITTVSLGVAGVKRVNFTLPASDITIENNELADLDTINVTSITVEP